MEIFERSGVRRTVVWAGRRLEIGEPVTVRRTKVHSRERVNASR